ncbi:MAG: hypothetical protein CME71_09075 [Halobacteriovorax sp.]|nr:hypothetical protein [Halobacteriovorax sp.]
MRITLLLFVAFFSLNLQAEETVRFAEFDDLSPGAESLVRANNGSGGFFFATYQAQSGNGDTVASAAQAWLPIDNGNSQRNRVSFAATTLVPDLSTGVFQTFIRVLNNSGSVRYLHVAVRDPDDTDDYYIVSGPTAFSSNTSQVLTWSQVSIANICTYTNCDDLNSGTTKTQDYVFYFFLSSSQFSIGTGDTFNTSQAGGAYLKGNFSVRLPTTTITIDELRRGDGRLKALFTGGTITDFNRTVAVINGSGTSVTGGGNVGTELNVAGAELVDLETASTSGEANIKPLVNGVLYSIGMAIEDKYQLTTVLSNVPAAVAPAQIEALLEKQACYILSAGFGEKHFITDYFRALRDKILLKTAFGTSFVDWYYNTAPRYTPLIYSSPVVAFVVRCLAFMAWFLINLALICLPIMLLVYALNRSSRKRV